MPHERITLPRTLVNQLLTRAQHSPEEEVCGLIGADTAQRFTTYPVTNAAQDPSRFFQMDAEQQIGAMRSMREAGQELFGIYHSHPTSPPQPSAHDLDDAAYPDALYLIVSLNTKGVLEMRGFRLRDGQAHEVELEI